MAEHTITHKTYYTIFVALMALLVATVAVSYIDLGSWNIVAALTIAVVKMMLVVLYFMHVRYAPKITWVFVSAGFFWLMIMVVLTLPDFFARYPH